MAQAIKQFVEREQRFMEAVKIGIAAADAGHLVDHADVKARWEAKRAAQVE
jgi:predicted transcriptional regulator